MNGDGDLRYINDGDDIHPSALGVDFISEEIGDFIYDNKILPEWKLLKILIIHLIKLRYLSRNTPIITSSAAVILRNKLSLSFNIITANRIVIMT